MPYCGPKVSSAIEQMASVRGPQEKANGLHDLLMEIDTLMSYRAPPPDPFSRR